VDRQVGRAIAVDRADEITCPVTPAVLAVGEDVQADLFLQVEGGQDGPVLDVLQLLAGNRALAKGGVGFEYFGRPQQAADVVSGTEAGRWGARASISSRAKLFYRSIDEDKA